MRKHKKATPEMRKRMIVQSIATSILSLASDKAGQLGSGKLVDNIMHDIFGHKNFIKRLCNISSDADIYDLFNGLNIKEIYEFLTEERIMHALFELVRIQRDIKSLRSKLKKRIKKGSKKVGGLKKTLKKTEKIYNEGIKSLRDILGLKKKNKKMNFKDMYPSLRNIIENHENPYYSMFQSSMDDDDDDFDDDDFADLTDDDYEVIGRVRPHRRRSPSKQELMDEFDDDDDDDFDDDDDDEDIEELRSDVGELKESTAKILSSLGAVMSKLDSPQVYNEYRRPLADTHQLEPVQRPSTKPSVGRVASPENNELQELKEVVKKLTNAVVVMSQSQEEIKETLSEILDNAEYDDEEEPNDQDGMDLMDTLAGKVDGAKSVEITRTQVKAVLQDDEDDKEESTSEPEDEDQSSENTENLSTHELVEKVNEVKSKPTPRNQRRGK